MYSGNNVWCHFLKMAGALGLIIVDDGACRGFDQGCVPGSSRLHQEGFASTDHEKLW